MEEQSNLQYQKELLDRMARAILSQTESESTRVVVATSSGSWLLSPGSVEWVAELPDAWTPLPGQPPWVWGLSYVRGQTRRLIDLSLALDERPVDRLGHVRVYGVLGGSDAWVALSGSDGPLARPLDAIAEAARREAQWLAANKSWRKGVERG